MSTKPQLEI